MTNLRIPTRYFLRWTTGTLKMTNRLKTLYLEQFQPSELDEFFDKILQPICWYRRHLLRSSRIYFLNIIVVNDLQSCYWETNYSYKWKGYTINEKVCFQLCFELKWSFNKGSLHILTEMSKCLWLWRRSEILFTNNGLYFFTYKHTL